MKKILSAVLVFVMLAGIVPMMGTSVGAMSFSDYKTKYTAFINDSRSIGSPEYMHFPNCV